MMPVVSLQKSPAFLQPSPSLVAGRVPSHAPARLGEAGSASHVTRAVSNTPHDWHRQLTDKAQTVGFQGVHAGDVSERLADQWVLVDVRPKASFAAGHHEGALNIPLFDKPENPGTNDLLKRAALRLNGVDYVDYNEGFVNAIKAAAAGGKGLIFVDEGGGRLVGEGTDPRGKASRSLKALYIAIEAGLSSVDFLRDGFKKAN